MRFLFVIYFTLVIGYYLLFYRYQTSTICWLSANFGKDFGTSFSASVLEDLFMFVFLTLAVSIVSIKMSTKNPEDLNFERRIRALINSNNIKSDDRVFDFVKEKVANLLAFNKVIKYEVFVTQYYAEKDAYRFTINRTQVATNMCKDRDFESQNNSIVIYPDLEINNSFGEVFMLGRVDPNNTSVIIATQISATSGDRELKKGRNELDFDSKIFQDSEIGILLTYCAYSEIGEDTNKERWSFCTASKYTSNVEFKLYNQLKTGKDFNFSLRRRNSDDSVRYVAEKKTLKANQRPYEHNTLTSLFPGERLEFYIYKPEL